MKPMIFEKATPESQGIDSELLLKALEAAENGAPRGIEIHDFLLLRHGKLVFEGYFAPYSAETKHTIFSQTKSFMSTAVGLAIYADGLLKLEDEVIRFFPEVDTAAISERAKKMRVCDLLSMASGHDEDTTDVVIEQGPQAYFELPLPYERGEHFLYNTGNSILLGMIVERVTGKSMYAYLKERVFDKIGITIEDGDWDRVRGVCCGGFGLHVKAMDVLRLANLYLLGGKWEGEQILPAEWVELVSKKKISNGDPKTSTCPSWNSGYSYQFWMCDYADAYRIDGAGGQQAAIVPSEDMVILFNSSLHGVISDYAQVLARYYVMPAVHEKALPENPAALTALEEKAWQIENPAPKAFAYPPEEALGRFTAKRGPLREVLLEQGEGETRVTFCMDESKPVDGRVGLDADFCPEGEEIMTFRIGLDGRPRVTEGEKSFAAKGYWDGARLHARATEFPSIGSIWFDLEVGYETLTVLVRTEWVSNRLPAEPIYLKRG